MMDVNMMSLLATLLPFLGGYVAIKIQRSNADFYTRLSKPWWSPPRILIPITWTYMYASIGYASYMVWRDGGGFDGQARLPLVIYGVKTLLNWAYTPLFFGIQNLGLATVDSIALWIASLLTMTSFYGINGTAGQLMFPYLIWISYATALSYWTWANNRNISKTK